ncbi:MAG: DUF523 domain-containing protein [Desulfuromonadaceae bacterium]|nr:DUF523 domain-containing protein [Desulfuromonadaceae bacterium]
MNAPISESQITRSRAVLVSACLLGLPTRYSGVPKENQRVRDFLRRHQLIPIPVCPEQLGGLPTPRPKTFFSQGDGEAVLEGTGLLVNEQGEERNQPFILGAQATLAIARECNCELAILKERSPSCGSRQIYLGSQLISGRGVACALLVKKGLQIVNEEEIEQLKISEK